MSAAVGSLIDSHARRLGMQPPGRAGQRAAERIAAGRAARTAGQPREAPHRRDDWAAQWCQGWDYADELIATAEARLSRAEIAAGRAGLAAARAALAAPRPARAAAWAELDVPLPHAPGTEGEPRCCEHLLVECRIEGTPTGRRLDPVRAYCDAGHGGADCRPTCEHYRPRPPDGAPPHQMVQPLNLDPAMLRRAAVWQHVQRRAGVAVAAEATDGCV